MRCVFLKLFVLLTFEYFLYVHNNLALSGTIVDHSTGTIVDHSKGFISLSIDYFKFFSLSSLTWAIWTLFSRWSRFIPLFGYFTHALYYFYKFLYVFVLCVVYLGGALDKTVSSIVLSCIFGFLSIKVVMLLEDYYSRVPKENQWLYQDQIEVIERKSWW